MDPSVTLVMPDLVPSIKVKVQAQAMETKTTYFDTAMHRFENMHIEFSKLSLNEVYEIQQEAATKVQLRENVVAYQEIK